MLCHLDADSFFASVLQRKHPRLRGKPLLALGMGADTSRRSKSGAGCVIAASYEAKAYGVKTGMPLQEARRLCPAAVHMASDFAETLRASKQIEALILQHCPIVEQYSIDEWFLDLTTLVGGVPHNLTEWARTIQTKIRKSADMSVSIGIGPSKILAKMASEERKPAGVTVILDADIEVFLRKHPAADIPGIGSARQVHAQAHHWETAWDIANAPPATVQRLFGRPGLDLQRELLGECIDPVRTETAPPKSISRCRSFPPATNPALVQASLCQHLLFCVLKMRMHGLQCRSVSVWLRDGRYQHHALRVRLPRPMDTEDMLLPYALALLTRLHKRATASTQIGIALTELCPCAPTQLSLFTPPHKIIEDERLQSSLDSLRKRFGREVIMRGSMLPVHKKRERMWEETVIEDEGLGTKD
jgi:DNA polymerase IV